MAKKVGDRIKAARLAQKARHGKHTFSQEQVARRVGVTVGMVSQWERNVSPPRSDRLAKLANVLEVSSDHLLGQSTRRAS